MWLFLACMVAARLFTAPGLMPERLADGTITLTICSPTGNTPARLDIPVERERSGDESASPTCPFALSVLHADMPDAPALAIERRAAMPAASQRFGRLSLGAYAPLPPATGPPALTA